MGHEKCFTDFPSATSMAGCAVKEQGGQTSRKGQSKLKYECCMKSVSGQILPESGAGRWKKIVTIHAAINLHGDQCSEGVSTQPCCHTLTLMTRNTGTLQRVFITVAPRNPEMGLFILDSQHVTKTSPCL